MRQLERLNQASGRIDGFQDAQRALQALGAGHRAEALLAPAETSAAQAVIIRSLVEAMTWSTGASAADVRNLACDMAAGMSPEVGVSVRLMLADAPTNGGTLQ